MTDSTPGVRPAALTTGASRNVLIIDGQYASIGARGLAGGKIDFKLLRSTLETLVGAEFSECWYFDHEPISAKSAYQSQNPFISALKLAPPLGPQFQVKMYAMKKYKCHCPSCGHSFTQHVQKGVDNGLATKMLSLAYEDMADRIVLFAGDGDFYDTLDLVRNVRRKDLWVVGYRDSVSADLQQLASKVIWMNDLRNITQQPSAALAPGRGAPVPSTTRHSVYVGRLPSATTEALLHEAFEHCGPMLSMRLHAARGFCFIDFPTDDAADLACELNDTKLLDRRIVVNHERPNGKQRPSPSPETTTTTLPAAAPRALSKRKQQPVAPEAPTSKKPKKSKSKSKSAKAPCRVLVNGLVPGTTERDVRALFGPFGAIEHVVLDSGQLPVRSCYITFRDEASVALAKRLDGSRRQDVVLRVETPTEGPKKNQPGEIKTANRMVDLVEADCDSDAWPAARPRNVRETAAARNHEVIDLCFSDDDNSDDDAADDQDTDDDSDF
ncbi:hypothetical protein SDRG_05569 [Saprolegnia diclina VS20]|uniref:Meiosis regulator and mRNA stability factor 1 n=1 Tax=Saprolegnia diclina (strain VS20) TaxID=1156394 RepID=T0S3L6_SAPDV|nr:hypothetical protein SDRG_05569 [Saprolegnia diclina VS20]EQC37352.1 hypothetical protein SDRG_05569 [Saprolegnia diclina VS20]|eukprot:XP_008609514.1 hypothetical protein SDRG_05569 [Saprolegnia diclina VS20]